MALGPDSPSVRAQTSTGYGGQNYFQTNPGYTKNQADTQSALQAIYGPQILANQAGYNQQLTGLQNQYNLIPFEEQYQTGNIQQNLANQLAQYGIQGAQQGLDVQGIQATQGYQQGQYGLQQQGLAAQKAFNTQQYGNTQAQEALAGQALQQQMAQDIYNANQQGQAVNRQTAASGAFGSQGRTLPLQNIWTQLAFQREANNRAMQQQFIQDVQAGQQYQYGQGELGRQQQSAAQTYGYQQGQQQRALQGAYLQARSLGLSEDQARQQAQQQITGVDLQGYNQGQSILGQIGQLNQQTAGQNVNPAFLTQWLQATG